MTGKIFDSELKIMELIWENEPVSAKEISLLSEKKNSWNKNTTYTVLKKLEEKGYIKRTDPGFICTSLISKSEIQKEETRGILMKLFNGSRKAMFAALLEEESLTGEDIAELRRMIEKR